MPRKATPIISPARRAELLEEVDETLDEIDEMEMKKKRVMKALNGQLQLLQKKLYLTRRKAHGHDVDQEEFAIDHGDVQPLDRGTEIEVAAILDQAKESGKGGRRGKREDGKDPDA